MNDVNEKSTPMTFERRAVDQLQDALIACCKDVPELKQVAIIFDWADDLNAGTLSCIVGDEVGPLEPTNLHRIQSMLGQVAETVSALSNLLIRSAALSKQHCEKLEARLNDAEKKTEAQSQQESEDSGEEEETSEQVADPIAETPEDRPA
jgi:hypothetical protein